MRKLILSVIVMAAAAMAAASDSQALLEADTKATVSQDAQPSYPVMRDPLLSKTSINANEVLVCTSRGCFAVHADLIDISKVFVARATNGQNVLVPYSNEVNSDQESGALSSTDDLHLPDYVIRLIEFAAMNPIYD